MATPIEPTPALAPEPTPAPEPAPAPAPEPSPAPEPAPAPQVDPNQFVSRDEYEQLAAQQRALLDRFNPPPAGPELDPEIAEFIAPYVQQMIGPMMPAVQTAAREAGSKRMNEIFDSVKAEKKVDFDYKLAERAAQALLSEIGDPVEATKQGALYAAEIRRQEREAGVEEYKRSLKKTPISDPSPMPGGSASAEPAKSYDEVIARWAAQEEV